MNRLLVFLPLILIPSLAFASGDVINPPLWLGTVIGWVTAIPVIGPYVVFALKWMGVISAVLTALVAAFSAVSKALAGVLHFAQLTEWAAKVEAFYAAISPYLKWLSMYNVQKK